MELACSGTSGVAKVIGWRPDVVILELMLPDVDGFELCRDLAGRAVAPIIILSARSQEVDKIRGLYLGADDRGAHPTDGACAREGSPHTPGHAGSI